MMQSTPKPGDLVALDPANPGINDGMFSEDPAVEALRLYELRYGPLDRSPGPGASSGNKTELPLTALPEKNE